MGIEQEAPPTESEGTVSESMLQKAIQEAVKEALEKQKGEIEALKRDNKKLQSDLQTAKSKIESLNEAKDAADIIEELRIDNEDLMDEKYNYQRLRYMLLFGKRFDMMRNSMVPILNDDSRRALISLLEGDTMLPRNAKTDERCWYDDLQMDNQNPVMYKFPVDYEKEEVEEEQ